MIKFDVKKRWNGGIQFTAEIECDESAPNSIKLGLAVRWGLKNNANLRYADLRYADLEGADLEDANLRYADLRGANLRGADLRYADIRNADLEGADLEDANLRYADLRGANLRNADLRGADLWNADIRNADLRGADLRYAQGLKQQPAQTVILPEGKLIVYKKLKEGVAKLEIPAKAKRSNATGRKCRAEYAKVLSLPKGIKEGTSKHDNDFKYRKNEIVRADKWCDDWVQECAEGIHFFITKEEAEQY